MLIMINYYGQLLSDIRRPWFRRHDDDDRGFIARAVSVTYVASK